MIVYLASPSNRHQAEALKEIPVLLSYAVIWSKPFMETEYAPTFSRVLIDSGAFSELTGAATVDIGAYRDWSEKWRGHADAIAGLDDISGDWKRSMRNYAEIPWGFPTFHESDPWELLTELVAMARERDKWLGVGLLPPRGGKEDFVRRVCAEVPADIHIHGWALRQYTKIRRIDSVDSTEWWRRGMEVRRDFPWLTYGEALEIVVKRYQRWERRFHDLEDGLFPIRKSASAPEETA